MSRRLVESFKQVRGKVPLRGAIAEIAEVAGHDAALSLMRHFGGRALNFPTRTATLNKDHPIVKATGLKAARLICGRILGAVIIPTGPFNDSAVKFYTYAKRRRDGAGVSRATAGLGIHDRTARKWNAILESGAVSNPDFVAYGKAIGDAW